MRPVEDLRVEYIVPSAYLGDQGFVFAGQSEIYLLTFSNYPQFKGLVLMRNFDIFSEVETLVPGESAKL